MDDITFALALLGAALGVFNTLWVLFRDAVRIRVTPIWKIAEGTIVGDGVTQGFFKSSDREVAVREHPDGQIGLRVINAGYTEITITSVGWSRSRWPKRHFKRWALSSTILADADQETVLPIRMQPRSAIVVWQAGRGTAVDGMLAGKHSAYARTACDITVFGSSGVLREVLRRARRSS